MLAKLSFFLLLTPMIVLAAPFAALYVLLHGSAMLLEEFAYQWRNWGRPLGSHWALACLRRPSDEPGQGPSGEPPVSG